MNKNKIITLVVLCIALIGCKQSEDSPVSASSIESTKKIETKHDEPVSKSVINAAPSTESKVPSLVSSCSSCHGEDGLAVNIEWPNLAGQKVEYLTDQIRAFRDGRLESPIMAASLVADLSDQDIDIIANYYSSLAVEISDDASKTDVFELPGAHVRARCISCHGMSGNSVTGLWPNIAGQNSGYLAKQLRDYKSGARQHPIMQVISGELNEQQIIDVAEYYSQAK